MGKSNSNLLNYIEHLLDEGNESQLRKFVVDPITSAENDHGLTKAERAVLRRVVSGLSNNSVNGYSIDRSLSSYRRSLRLLQNVLHNVGTKMVQDHLVTEDTNTYSLVLYYPNSSGTNDYTCKDQNYLDENGGNSYAHSQTYHINLPNSSYTIQAVMEAMANDPSVGLQYATDDPKTVVNSFTVGGSTFTANLHNQDGSVNPCYDLGKNPDAHNVFWFWNINGNPGGQSESFAKAPVYAGDTIKWQLIAPCGKSGFVCCHPHPQNAFGKQKAAELRAV